MDCSQLAVRQRADVGHDRRARLPLPAPQPQLLLRAQHVHDRDGDRARRLHRVPDRAAALHARVGLHRLASRTSPACTSRTPSASMNALFNPYAAVPSMHVAFALMIGWPLARLARRRVVRVAVAALPVPDDVRDRRHRQPLHRRRAARRAHRRRLGLRRDAGSRARGPACGASRPSRRARHGERVGGGARRCRPGSTPRTRRARRSAARARRAAARRARRSAPGERRELVRNRADRVAPDAERDLADRLRAERASRRCSCGSSCSSSAASRSSSARSWTRSTGATRACRARARRSARSWTRRSTASRRASC